MPIEKLTPEQNRRAISERVSPRDVEGIAEEPPRSLEEEIRAVLENLTARDVEVMKKRHGLEDGVTYALKEIGEIFRGRVRRSRPRQ